MDLLVLGNVAAGALHVRDVSRSQPLKRRAHPGRSHHIEVIEPPAKGRAAGSIEILGDADPGQGYGNVYVTIMQAAYPDAGCRAFSDSILVLFLSAHIGVHRRRKEQG